VRYVGQMDDKCIQNFDGKPEGKCPLARIRRSWEDHIKLVLEKYDGKIWTGFISLKIETIGGFL